MRLPILNRFQTRLVLLFVSLFILVQIATYAAVYLVTVRNLDGEASRHLSYSGEIFTRAMQERTDMLADGAAVLSNDFGFREAVATDDDPTIISALSNLAGRIGADRSFLIGLDRQVRADTGTSAPLVGQAFPMSGLLDHAEQHGRAVAIRELDGQLYDFVVVPVLAPVTIAWVGLGIRLDDAEARAVRDLMPQGMEVAFLDASGSGPQVLASSMPLLSPDLPAVLPRSGGPASLELAGGEYLARAIDLRDDDGAIGATALLQYSMDVAFSPYRALIYALRALLAVGMAVLAWSSTLVAGSVSRPLRLLADAAGKVSRGDYQPVALTPSGDEIGQLTDSFNRMVTSIEERERTITYQAEHDSETGLPNRRKFEALLNMFIETSPRQSISVVVVTVERVNEVRNTFGFSTWERLIGLIGPRLIDSASGAGMIARLSTVSFIIAFPELDVAAARRAADDLRGGFEQPFIIDAFTIDSNAQIGIANYPDHAMTAEGLVQKASIAVMQGQASGASVSVYDPERDSHTAQRLSLMGDLKKGLAAGEVLFYYQPKIDLKRGVMSHVEALVRWRHPKLGFIPPDEFITLAEQTGHIGHLTAWALESAIR